MNNEVYIIVEWNGPDYISLMLNGEGEVEKFDSEEAAKKYANLQCSFNHKIVRIY